MVKRVSQSSATLDFNHPLAGKELVFEVSLLGFA
jgi:FKBP-type peptidyl-prolyl cis-trans isomerase 2